MNHQTENLKQFLVWLRNGTAFCTTWFLVLLIVYSHMFNQPLISIDFLTKMLFLIVGAVLLFSICFTRVLIKKLSFTKRLTGFMLSISVYECALFYGFGYFTGKGSLIQWIGFIGIVFGLYLCCMAIYRSYRQKKGEIYTQALQNYQRERMRKNEH